MCNEWDNANFITLKKIFLCCTDTGNGEEQMTNVKLINMDVSLIQTSSERYCSNIYFF